MFQNKIAGSIWQDLSHTKVTLLQLSKSLQKADGFVRKNSSIQCVICCCKVTSCIVYYFAYISKERHSCVLKHMCLSLCAGIYYVLISQLWRACFAIIVRYRSAVVYL